MKNDRPSFTAAYVAGARALGALLPPEARLCEDPFGATFAGAAVVDLVERLGRGPDLLRRATLRIPGVRRDVLWLQVRTRVLDDELVAFLLSGGRQVVLLGAGFDCRAARFARALAGSMVFEVDHPATQSRKRSVLRELGAESGPVSYIAWDFERDPMRELPARLSAHGHDPRAPTLTIWEGVTMYLTADAIDQSVAAVRAASARGSRLAFTYFERAVLERPPVARRISSRVVARVGEPFRFGWDPRLLPAWLEQRGFTLRSDGADVDLAARLLPAAYARGLARRGNHVAVAERGLDPEPARILSPPSSPPPVARGRERGDARSADPGPEETFEQERRTRDRERDLWPEREPDVGQPPLDPWRERERASRERLSKEDEALARRRGRRDDYED